MRPSDEIREHVIRRHFQPAKSGGATELTIRAGDIHKELDYANRMPAVCSVLGSNRLEREAAVTLSQRNGPHNGANALFTYLLLKN